MPARCQLDRRGQHAVRLDPEERAAVEIERFADPPQRIAHRVIDLVGREVDELRRQLGDQPLELELALYRRAIRRFRLAPRRHVDDFHEHEGAAIRRDRIQPDLDRKLRAVTAAPED